MAGSRFRYDIGIINDISLNLLIHVGTQIINLFPNTSIYMYVLGKLDFKEMMIM